MIDQNWITSTATVDRYQYAYDQDSEVVARNNMLNSQMNEAYQYNNLGELTKFQHGSHTETWNPDALGNFSSVTNDGSTQTNSFNQQNQYSSGGVTYDADGNLTADGKGWTYTYDAWNRLITANYNNSPVATYSYDGLNRQVQIIENNCTTDIYYSAQGQAVEEYINGSVSSFSVWSPVYVNALVFRAEVYPKTGTGGNVIRYYALQDANWNITAWVDNLNGSIDERYAYDPYGAITVLNPDWSPFTGTPLHLPFGFQGMRTDWFVANLNFSLGTRVDDPEFGTWMQMDPLGEATGPNGYEAYGNQPTDLVDPSGLSPWDYITAVGQGLYEGVQNLGIGAKNTAVEMGQMARDLGNTVAAAGALATGNVYDYDLHSNTFGGFDRAVRQGEGDRFLLNAMADGASLGVKPLVEGVIDFAQTGDATRASQTAGGVAAGNLAQAAMIKVSPKIPLPRLRARLIGAGRKGAPPSRIPLKDVPVTRQPTANTCVPASVDMLLDEVAPGRTSTIIEGLNLRRGGVTGASMSAFVADNLEAAGLRVVRGSLSQALKTNRPFIAIVDEGHAVVVQGIREVQGVRYVVVRDPLRGAYLEALADFDARLVRDPKIVSHPTIWGEKP